MFCANCGTKQNEGEKFCPNCGTRFEDPLKVEEVKAKEVVKPEVSEPKGSVPEKKDTIIEQKEIKKDKSKNTPQQKDEDNELNKLKEEADKGNKEAQMSLAIKYEFGLGVSIDMDMAKKYYAMIDCNGSNPQSFLIDIDNNKQSGIISDKYQIESTVVYDSEIERPKVKSKLIKEGEIIFRCLIKSEDMSDDLLELIKQYKHCLFYWKRKHVDLGNISASNHDGYYWIECVFTELKDISHLGFFTSISYENHIDSIKAALLNIIELCESLRM